MELGKQQRCPGGELQEEVDGAAQGSGGRFAAGEDEDAACESEFFGGEAGAFGVFGHVAVAS